MYLINKGRLQEAYRLIEGESRRTRQALKSELFACRGDAHEHRKFSEWRRSTVDDLDFPRIFSGFILIIEK